MKVLTARSMRLLEAAAVDEGLDYLRLMENAGSAAARHIRQLDSLYVSSLFWNLIFGFVMTLVIGRKRPGLVRDEYIENAVSVFIGGVAPKEGEAWR